MLSSCNTEWQVEGERGKLVTVEPLLGLQNHCGVWLQPWNQKMIASWQESNDKPRQYFEKQSHYSADKGPYSQGYGLPSGHEGLWKLDHKEGRLPKNWCLQTVVLKKMPENPLVSKDISLPTKVFIVKVMVCPLIMYGCESRTIKKAERQRIDAFKLWCYRRLLKVLWTARRSNQSILREINLEYSLEGLMLKLKLQYFSHLMQTDLEKSLGKVPRC